MLIFLLNNKIFKSLMLELISVVCQPEYLFENTRTESIKKKLNITTK